MSYNLPNPSLLGILLIISTHSGPQLVFNYPDNLSGHTEDSEVNSSGEEAEDDYEDEEEEMERRVRGIDHISSKEHNEKNGDATYLTKNGQEEDLQSTKYKVNEWDSHHLNYYMGTKKDLISFLDEQELSRKKINAERNHTDDDSFNPSATKETSSSTNNTIFSIDPTYLSEMLSPPRKMCNSRFEIMIDNKIFLGLPIHKLDGGIWRKESEEKERKHKDKESVSKLKSNDSSGKMGLNSPGGQIPIEDKTENGSDANSSSTNINMFHLVFIMNPPVIESNYRIDEMFHFVISRLSLVLRYEQSKNEYISSQVKQIFNIKEQHKNSPTKLCQHLINKSSLCKLISDCYGAISQSKIANLSINSKLRSFQIPIKTEFHSLPETSVPYIPGSHLSSTVKLLKNSGLISVGETERYSQSSQVNKDYLGDQDEEDISNSSDDVIYFALLLLDDPESIIRDLKTEHDSTLAKFIRMIKPTESLLKLSLRYKSLDLLEIKLSAFHLIYWRRARVIQPLSTRSTYIISPMAPVTINIFNDIVRFRKAYPSLPSLPNFLKLITPKSKKPQQFASIIPSKDHRDIYLDALSWLIRFGYVTQLQTFIWLKVSKKIKLKVEEDLENESLNKKKGSVSKKVLVTGTDNTSKVIDSPASQSNAKNVDKEIDNMQEMFSGANLNNNVILEEEEDTIVLDPGRATTLEGRWIKKIVYDECKLSPELTALFYKLLKYMNGKSPLEMLLLKENISRNELRKLLLAIEEYIISVRHW